MSPGMKEIGAAKQNRMLTTTHCQVGIADAVKIPSVVGRCRTVGPLGIRIYAQILLGR